MKKYVMSIAVFLMFLVITAVCFYLPPRLFTLSDNQRKKETAVGKEDIVIQANAQIPFKNKLELIYYQPSSLELIPVSQGTEQKKDLEEVLRQEISSLKKVKALPKKFRPLYDKLIKERNFVINTDNPEEYMYIWTMDMPNNSGSMSLRAAIEEESGKVVYFSMYSRDAALPIDRMRKGYCNYLGMNDLVQSIYFSPQDQLGDHDFITGIYAYEYLGYMGNMGVGKIYKENSKENDSSGPGPQTY